jgi:hypothetical protein
LLRFRVHIHPPFVFHQKATAETASMQGLPAEDAESALDLIEPAGVRRGKVKMHVGVMC